MLDKYLQSEKSTLKAYIFFSILATFIIYMTFSLGNLSFDITNWETVSRGIATFFFFVIYVAFFFGCFENFDSFNNNYKKELMLKKTEDEKKNKNLNIEKKDK